MSAITMIRIIGCISPRIMMRTEFCVVETRKILPSSSIVA